MSDALFITSPIILRWSLSTNGKISSIWLVYASLNLICVISFLLTILTMPLVGHIDPHNSDIQLLPGFVVWATAQVILTVAATLKL